jgi:DNA adenine methylase
LLVGGTRFLSEGLLSLPKRRQEFFIKWVGGKRQLLEELRSEVPLIFSAYHEPMVGGGSFFFSLQREGLIRESYLSDINERLIRTYLSVRDEVEKVIELLSSYPLNEVFFKELRKVDIDAKENYEVAAWLLYLTKTCYSGLYRVNKNNGFNAPYGNYEGITICNSDLLRKTSQELQSSKITCIGFEESLAKVKKDDFVYIDPPYIPLNTTSFVGYTSDKFGMANQKKLRDLAYSLKYDVGAYVLLSNSWCDETLSLYSNGFKIREIKAFRYINRDKLGRGKISEALIV